MRFNGDYGRDKNIEEMHDVLKRSLVAALLQFLAKLTKTEKDATSTAERPMLHYRL
jgi:hypothetical protein